jgi:hypothetical protein
MTNLLRNSSEQMAVVPHPQWYVNGMLVSDPANRSDWFPDPAPMQDAAALHSYVERMRSRSVDTFDFRRPPTPLQLDWKSIKQ